MYVKGLFAAGVLALASATAFATAQDGGYLGSHDLIVQGPHAKMTFLAAEPIHTFPAVNAADAGLVTIFSSMASKYPKGEYWCCTGYNVMGPGSGAGEQWMGASFTPSANHTVTRIEVAVGYSGQGANGVVISLNKDKAGVPGAAIRTWNASNLPTFGTCCVVTVRTDKAGIPVRAGKQYWLVLSTNGNETNTVDGWNVSDADQVDLGNMASYSSNTWHVFQTAPGLAYAVKGTN